jgi:hypothetical protein
MDMRSTLATVLLVLFPVMAHAEAVRESRLSVDRPIARSIEREGLRLAQAPSPPAPEERKQEPGMAIVKGALIGAGAGAGIGFLVGSQIDRNEGYSGLRGWGGRYAIGGAIAGAGVGALIGWVVGRAGSRQPASHSVRPTQGGGRDTYR